MIGGISVGSGIVLTSYECIFRKLISLRPELEMPQFFGCDINAKALQVTSDLLKHNSDSVDLVAQTTLVESDLCDSIQQKDFDIMVFNPPYVVIDEAELVDA